MSCPICSKATVSTYKPFCSKRCADIDLAKWLGGGYAIPSTDPADAEAVMDALEKHHTDEKNTASKKLH